MGSRGQHRQQKKSHYRIERKLKNSSTWPGQLALVSHPDPSPPPSPAPPPPPPTPPLPPRPRPLVLPPFPLAVNPPSEVRSSADDVKDVKAAGDAKEPEDDEDDEEEEGRVDTTTRSLLDNICTETGAWIPWERSEHRRFRNATRWHLGRRRRGGR